MAKGWNLASAQFTLPLRVGFALFGVASFGAGVLAVFTTVNGAGAAALLAIGAASVGFAVLGDRVQSIGLGAATLTLHDVARQTFALAKEAELQGDSQLAERLHASGQALQELARSYAQVRSSMRTGNDRTAGLEQIVSETRKLAQNDSFEPRDVATWFGEGTPEARITALGLMQGNQRLRSFEAALEAVEGPKSAFEQYHGMVLAEMMVTELTTVQRAQLTTGVKRALGSLRVRHDSDRSELGVRILQALDPKI